MKTKNNQKSFNMTEIKTNGIENEERRQIVANNLRILAERRKEGLISPDDFPLEGIFYVEQEGRPLVRSDLGNRAIVISQRELEQFGFISFLSPEGKLIDIFADETGYEPEEVLVIFPDELGEVLKPG